MKRRFLGAMSLPLLTRSSEAATVQPADVLADTSRRTSGPLHDPPLEPRDEAVFLLTAAAEIEHALMVQYLYAAYSLRIVDGELLAQKLKLIQELLLQIAREEMGHLATVQNLLHLLGDQRAPRPGTHTQIWNLADDSGQIVSRGPFIYRILSTMTPRAALSS